MSKRTEFDIFNVQGNLFDDIPQEGIGVYFIEVTVYIKPDKDQYKLDLDEELRRIASRVK